jgi:hypothetical protein
MIWAEVHLSIDTVVKLDKTWIHVWALGLAAATERMNAIIQNSNLYIEKSWKPEMTIMPTGPCAQNLGHLTTDSCCYPGSFAVALSTADSKSACVASWTI